MQEEFSLEKYLSGGVENIVREAVRATLSNPQESLFMAKYAVSSRAVAKKRAQAELAGEHIPPFLIASITSSCNLHCAGCYARANEACSDCAPVDQLSAGEWQHIFREARDLGVGFILLAGGEPMMRPDVIRTAAALPEILFPVFTNGTMMNEEYIKVFEKHRNLVPVVSIEGREEKTDSRRGEGVYNRTMQAMRLMQEHKVIYGASVTVTTENLQEVTSDAFLEKLAAQGCKVVFYVEFVPTEDDAKELAPQEREREFMNSRLAELRTSRQEMLFISFPGDEKTSGGCLAAGRGFFHINSHGGAEPCPFSPYSDINVRDTSLKKALDSKLFTGLRDKNILMEDHAGGCVLFERREMVEELLYQEG